MTVEWEGRWGQKRVGSKWETLMKYEGLSMSAWFLPSTTSAPLPPLSSTCPRDTKSEVGNAAKPVLNSKEQKAFEQLLFFLIIITLQLLYKGNI